MSVEMKDPKEPTRSLLSKIGTGLDNPMLVAIAEAAPSPTAADHHVTQTLGWPNEVGRVVREMVRLRQQVADETWNNLIVSSFRLADGLFKFNEMHQGLWFETGIQWAGEVADRTNWPLLLREMKMADKSTPATTYDGCGDAPTWRVSELDLYDPSFTSSGAFHRQAIGNLELSILVTTKWSTCWRLAHPEDSSEKGFEVRGKSVTLLPKPPERIFPEFWKILKIKKSWRKEFAEEIIVAIRRDFYPASIGRFLGNLIYGKDIALKGPFRKAILEINYSIWPDFSLTLKTNGNPPISISCDEGELSPNVSCINPDEMAKGVKDLGDTVLKILYPPNLGEISGRGLVKNPPETLADLLAKE